MSDQALRLGTRRSKLAMAQSGQVAEKVRRLTGRPVELVEITTYGDVSREQLAQIGGTGVFVTALREALLRGEVDFAVHSLKDLPTTHPDDLALAAVPVREDARDVLIARDGLTFEQLPAGARVGTGSPRRMSQLNAYARSHEPGNRGRGYAGGTTRIDGVNVAVIAPDASDMIVTRTTIDRARLVEGAYRLARHTLDVFSGDRGQLDALFATYGRTASTR